MSEKKPKNIVNEDVCTIYEFPIRMKAIKEKPEEIENDVNDRLRNLNFDPDKDWYEVHFCFEQWEEYNYTESEYKVYLFRPETKEERKHVWLRTLKHARSANKKWLRPRL